MTSLWNKAPSNLGVPARAAQITGTGTAYDAFLYATIGADRDELSVLSALARMNLDPWQEAAELAKLSATAATGRLAALIAAVPGMSAAAGGPGTAARLIKLLPHQGRTVRPALPERRPLSGVAALAQSRMALYMLFGLIALALAILLFGARRPQSPPPSPTHVSKANPPSSGAANNARS